MKPGYKTTEFWLTMAGHVVNGLVQANVFPNESGWQKGIIFSSAMLAQIAYTISRGNAKSKDSKAE